MKIITEDCAYVQKNDIAYLNSYDLPIPASIYMKIFGNGVTIINSSNRYDFVKFEDKEEIEFFKSLDWMIDYNQVDILTYDGMLDFGQSITDEREKVAERFNDPNVKLTDEEKKEIAMQYELLDFKLKSLMDIMKFKQGILSIELPEELFPKENSERKGFKKLLRKVINRK